MLKVIGIADSKIEQLELSGYTLLLRWNHLYPSGHVFWRTGDFQKSLLEIGLNADNYGVEVLTLVNIQRDWIVTSEVVDINPQTSKRFGLPVCDWIKTWPLPRVLDEHGRFRLYIGETHLSICLNDSCTVSEIFVAGRTQFGVDDQNNLVTVQMVELIPDEINTVKSTFFNLPSHAHLFEISIDTLELSQKSRKAVVRTGITTVGDCIDHFIRGSNATITSRGDFFRRWKVRSKLN